MVLHRKLKAELYNRSTTSPREKGKTILYIRIRTTTNQLLNTKY